MVYFVKDQEDFERKIAAAGVKLVVVDFFAVWCAPSVSVDPELEELTVKYADQTVVLKVDVDKCKDLAKQYKVECVPKFVFLQCGRVASEFSGTKPGKLEETIKRLIEYETCPVRWS